MLDKIREIEEGWKDRISDSIPYLKLEDDIVSTLQSGLGDFYLILNYMELASTTFLSRNSVRIRQTIESWNAPIGFEIRANSISELMQAIKTVAKENASWPTIYFDCHWPGRRTNHVEREKTAMKSEIEDIRRGIRRKENEDV